MNYPIKNHRVNHIIISWHFSKIISYVSNFFSLL